MKRFTCGFVGLGLIGGSILKAIKKAHPAISCIAYDRNEETRELALKDGLVSAIYPELVPAFGACDFLFFCAPVENNIENLKQIKDCIQENCILTDVGSVKTGIHKAIDELELTASFIGGHPMAGSERIGYRNSDALLLENAYYLLTPTNEVPSDAIDRYYSLVSAMGAIPLILDYEKHDYVTAAISHLPHIIAATLVNLVKNNDDKEELMKLIAAGGFKDITRIASSSPEMWQQICLTNGENIRILLETYMESLKSVSSNLETNTSLFELFHNAKQYRDTFIDTSSGPIKKVYDLYMDIPDIPGALAKTATILAEENISIKNIGIRHSREYQQGVLRIELYDELSVSKATALLEQNHYTLYS